MDPVPCFSVPVAQGDVELHDQNQRYQISVDEAQQSLLHRNSAVIVASRHAAELIVRARSQRLRTNRPNTLYLSGVPFEASDYATRFGKIARSLGAHRQISFWDYITYSLGWTHDIQKTPEGVLQSHPSWPLAYVAGADQSEFYRELVLTVGDPRWFVDADKPDGEKRVTSYFGLGQNGAQRIVKLRETRKPIEPNSVAARLDLLLKAWAGPDWRCANPSRFPDGLYRQFFEEVRKTVNIEQTFLHVSRGFLRVFLGSWLGHIFPPREFSSDGRMQKQAAHYQQLFVPKYCIPHNQLRFWEDTVAVWRRQVDYALAQKPLKT